MLADSHTHLLDPRLKERAEKIIKNLKQEGLEFIVEISADPQEAKDALIFANSHDNVYCTAGVHPVYADKYSDEFENWVTTQKNKKIVAVGECGLDYYHKDCPTEIQKKVFIKHIKLADKTGLPLVVHTRDAFNDTIEILNANKQFINNGLLVHCFSGSAAEVELFKPFDAYFAFGGAITYKNAVNAAEAIRAVPRGRLMIETDCPYLTPVPYRGQINEPKNVKLVAEHIARILDLTVAEVEVLTLENTKRFYRIK